MKPEIIVDTYDVTTTVTRHGETPEHDDTEPRIRWWHCVVAYLALYLLLCGLMWHVWVVGELIDEVTR